MSQEINQPLNGAGDSPNIRETPITKVALQYLKNTINNDQNTDNYAQNSMQNQFQKALFNVLIKLSYALFVFGVVITLQSTGEDQQQFWNFLSDPNNKPFLIVLSIQGVIIITMFRLFKQDNKITPLTKKYYNFFSDISRTIFYILLIVFLGPFAFGNVDSSIIIASFWIYLVALVLFIFRKTVKWLYYLKDEEGSKIVKPWEDKGPNSEDQVAKSAQFIKYIYEKGIIKKDGSDLLKGLDKLIPNNLQVAQLQKLKQKKQQIEKVLKQVNQIQ